MVQMISHGFISGAMFLCVGVLYDRMHSREIGDYGGVVNTMPWFGAFVVFFAMANAGLPGTSGFVGEFMVILASFRADFWFAFLAATTLILGRGLYAVDGQAGGLRPVGNDEVAQLKDLNGRETLNLGMLAAATLAIGIWPKPLVEVMEPSIEPGPAGPGEQAARGDHAGRQSQALTDVSRIPTMPFEAAYLYTILPELIVLDHRLHRADHGPVPARRPKGHQPADHLVGLLIALGAVGLGGSWPERRLPSAAPSSATR
jgi:formate hydrogenlyase subunit 3/multisubunit Na+/H+ antiporter MnhD subunit